MKYRISEASRAKLFIQAYTYNKDDVYTRCVFWRTAGDIFAADLYAHKSCMKWYLKQYSNHIHDTLESLREIEAEETNETKVQEAFDSVCDQLELTSRGYAVSECRKSINDLLGGTDLEVNNRQVKSELIRRYGTRICFTYATNKSISQMFFSTSFKVTDVAETVRRIDTTVFCAKDLRKECKDYKFGLVNSYKDADDLRKSYEVYKQNRPGEWRKFFQIILDKSQIPVEFEIVFDLIFQIFYAMIHGDSSQTPFAIAISEMIHEKCRNKHIMILLNRLKVCTSYDSMSRIDTGLTKRVIQLAEGHRVPVPAQIQSNVMVHGAMDNFDDGPSHDTVLMLFQNPQTTETVNGTGISKKEEKIRSRKLAEILECQQVIPSYIGSKRGTIPATYPASAEFSEITNGAFDEKLWQWTLLRYHASHNAVIDTETQLQWVPSFSATMSILSDVIAKVSIQAFTPILPYPITEYDSVNTVMKNFQDVLKQKNLPYGPLWCDEGVYHIAKELQLLKPETFSNIFLGLGGFHMEKNVLSAIGQYLSKSGARELLVANGYGPTVTDNKIMTGKHYVLARQAFRKLHEALSRLRFQKFEEKFSSPSYKEVIDKIATAPASSDCTKEIRERWNTVESCTGYKELKKQFAEFVSSGNETSENFRYWNTFLDVIFPVLNDLTQSFRHGDWNKHLSAVRRAIPLFFAFGHTNYSRWTPIYYEECLNLPLKYPLLQTSFSNCDFVVHHTDRKGNSVPIDQALESAYNKPAKGPGGIIGISKKKESVAKWNLIKHEKAKYTQFLDDLTDFTYEDEYSLHHEFSDSVTRSDEEDVKTMLDYLAQRSDIVFTGSLSDLSNIVSGEVFDDQTK